MSESWQRDFILFFHLKVMSWETSDTWMDLSGVEKWICKINILLHRWAQSPARPFAFASTHLASAKIGHQFSTTHCWDFFRRWLTNCAEHEQMFSKNTANANKWNTGLVSARRNSNQSKNVIRKRKNHCIECSEFNAEFDECLVEFDFTIVFTFRIIANLHLCDVLISSCPTFWTNNTMCVLNMWNDYYFFFLLSFARQILDFYRKLYTYSVRMFVYKHRWTSLRKKW